MEIDVAAVNEAGEAAHGNSTAAMAQALARQIDGRLRTTRASQNLHALEAIVRHMDPLFSTYITGIAVRVPGTITGADASDELLRQVNELTQQVSRDIAEMKALRDALGEATRENTTLKARLRGGDTDQTVAQWRQRAQDLDHALALSKGKVTQLEDDLTIARREKGIESIRAERAEQERDAARVALTQQADDAQKTKGKLNGEITQLELDIAQLNGKLKQLHAQLDMRQDAQAGPDGKSPVRSTRVKLPQHIGADE